MSTRVTGAGLDPGFLADFTTRWMAAWNDFDAAALCALCTEDIVYDDPALPRPAHGYAEVAELLASLGRAFPDMHYVEPEPPHASHDAEKGIGLWEMTATFTGRLDPPGFAPNGARLELRGIDEWRFRDGRAHHYRAYFDSYGVARLIGAAPPADSRLERLGAFAQRAAARLSR